VGRRYSRCCVCVSGLHPWTTASDAAQTDGQPARTARPPAGEGDGEYGRAASSMAHGDPESWRAAQQPRGPCGSDPGSPVWGAQLRARSRAAPTAVEVERGKTNVERRTWRDEVERGKKVASGTVAGMGSSREVRLRTLPRGQRPIAVASITGGLWTAAKRLQALRFVSARGISARSVRVGRLHGRGTSATVVAGLAPAPYPMVPVHGDGWGWGWSI
jgi:hypothetical protein